MKTLIAGIVLLLVLGIGGFFYRAEVENRSAVVACPLDAKVCPDGTSVGRIGLSCTFPVCPPPNMTLSDINIAFALPDGYAEIPGSGKSGGASYYMAYGKQFIAASSTNDRADMNEIDIEQYQLDASSTPISIIQKTAIGDASGAPVPATAYSSIQLGTHRFTVVSLGRFEGVIHMAYYLARGSDVLRFDALDRGVDDWTNPNLNLVTLPANAALRGMLGTVQGN